MRPLNLAQKQRVRVPYTPPASVDLSSIAVVSNRVFKTTNPFTLDCLEVWEEEVAAGPVAADKAVVLRRIKGIVDRTYRCAATPLIEAYGRYCAYCETPISELVQVEHLLPKSQYPTFALDPDNLLLACGPCNRRKTDTPTRVQAAPWLNASNPTASDYKQAIRDRHYCWPDIDPSLIWLPLRLEALDDGRWKPVSETAAVSAGLVRTSPLHSVPVRADLPSDGLWDVEIRVVVFDDHALSAGRGQEMIAMCGLNEVGSGTNDSRLHHRTKVWLDAVGYWHAELCGATSVPASLSASFLDVAGLSGCFSVWAATGEAILPGLRDLFAGEAAHWFPGTDSTRM